MRILLGLAVTAGLGGVGWAVGEEYLTDFGGNLCAFTGVVFGLLIAAALSAPTRPSY